jgi:hypothetical protein
LTRGGCLRQSNRSVWSGFRPDVCEGTSQHSSKRVASHSIRYGQNSSAKLGRHARAKTRPDQPARLRLARWRPGHRAVPESGKLQEDEPHPVALLLTAAQFGKDTQVYRFLRIEEALEIEGIGHGAGLVRGRFTSSASLSRSGRWPSRLFTWADGRLNHSARSISGKLCIRPPFGGHSISKVLLLTGAPRCHLRNSGEASVSWVYFANEALQICADVRIGNLLAQSCLVCWPLKLRCSKMKSRDPRLIIRSYGGVLLTARRLKDAEDRGLFACVEADVPSSVQ